MTWPLGRPIDVPEQWGWEACDDQGLHHDMTDTSAAVSPALYTHDTAQSATDKCMHACQKIVHSVYWWRVQVP